eukprot:5151930-Alexandrium_andersonii.AAC.1
MTLADRRALGHWRPNSHMPVRYGQARCCAELRKKAELRAVLAKGFVPSGDFEIPKAAEVETVGEDVAKQAAAHR